MNKSNTKTIDLTVLVTSFSQREITIATANYYSEICNEVILVDEQKPYLSEIDINLLNEKGIRYISYEANENTKNPILEKRLIAASMAKNVYVAHSNHDERYTYHGLLASFNELENDKNLTFCAGQAIAVRRNKKGIYYTRQYKNLCGYENINNVEDRIYHHAETYAPLAHYSLWRKNAYIDVINRTMRIHGLMPSDTIMEEVIFELAADVAGNSKATPELYWIRNRVNDSAHGSFEKGEHIFKTIECKLQILLNDVDNIQLNRIMDSFRSNFPFIKPSNMNKRIIKIKRIIRKFIKKKNINDIDVLLKDNKIKYEKNDLSNVLESMSL